MAKRYDQMFALIDKVKPERIIEVGVHRGIRAAKLCARALVYRQAVDYTGFDVFDTMDAVFLEQALKGKGAPSEAAAASRLNSLGAALSHRFVVGDTRLTMHGTEQAADFAFIDGDHRVDAIAGDYAAVAGARCVVFDDYYRADENGWLPDLALYGANAVVDELAAAGRKVQILPVADRCKHGGVSHLAVVWL
jgi:hypothetical protein